MSDLPATKSNPWTAAQRLAIDTIDHNVLVSAAAGSGKTSVLAERCAQLVCRDDAPCAVTELLVVTFTRAAASEMRSRIESRLRERLTACPNDRRLARQLALLDRAEIGTLHSFCGRLVRRHFGELGVDPAFVQLDEHESRLLRNEVAERLFDERFSGHDADAVAAFTWLLDAYCDGDPVALRSLVLRTYDLSRSTPDPQAWQAAAIKRLQDAVERPLAESTLGRELRAEVALTLRGLLGRVERLRRRAKDQFNGYEPQFAKIIGGLHACAKCISSGDWAGFCAAVREAKDDLGRAPTFELPDDATKLRKKYAKELFDEARQCTWHEKSRLFQLARFDETALRDGMSIALPAGQQLVRLVDAFEAAYTRAKQSLRALDFTDLERLALRVLADPDAPPGVLRPSSAARAYHEQYRHVLVDEYQDINALQDAILRLVSRECLDPGERGARRQPANLFCVGDVKQSIYRFRLADPSLFLARAARFSGDTSGAGEAGTPGDGRLIPLAENFRSIPPILDAVNAVFERLMTPESAEIAYDATQRLVAGKRASDYGPYPAEGAVSLYVVPTEKARRAAEADNEGEPPGGSVDDDALDLDRTEREAAVVAGLIREAVGTTAPENRFDYGQIAVLLRAMKHKAVQFAAILRRFGIPVLAEVGDGFFTAQEVIDAVSLLRVLDNPLQDIPLAAVLRGPFLGLSGNADDALAQVRLCHRGLPFHRAVSACARGAPGVPPQLARELSDRLATMDRWRALARRRPVAEMLWQVMDECGVMAWNAALHDGEQRVANLLHLFDLARAFGTFQKQGLKRFLAFLDDLSADGDMGQATLVRNPGNVVRIMSVHRSKGLQFPLVIVPDLGAKRNVRDLGGRILLDRDTGIAPRVVDLGRRVHYLSMASYVARERAARKLVAEELRVLYVAMTRAERRLVLLGSTDRPEAEKDWQADWKGHAGPLPPEVTAGQATLLDWLGPACAAGADAHIRIVSMTPADVDAAVEQAGRFIAGPSVPEAVAQLRADLLPAGTEADAARAERDISALAWKSPLRGWSTVPAARAVTQLTKTGRAAEGGHAATDRAIVPFTRPLRRPRFAEPPGEATMSATEAGMATHRVLQSMRLSGLDPTAEAVRAELHRLVADRLLDPVAAEVVDVAGIVWLLNTDLGRLIRACGPADAPLPRLHRELPIFAPASPEQTAQAAAPRAGVSPASPTLALPDTRDPYDRTLLRGQIDALIETDDGKLVVADYKTDRLTDATLPSRVAFYRPQVQAYAAAVAALAGRPVSAAVLVFLGLRKVVDVSA